MSREIEFDGGVCPQKSWKGCATEQSVKSVLMMLGCLRGGDVGGGVGCQEVHGCLAAVRLALAASKEGGAPQHLTVAWPMTGQTGGSRGRFIRRHT